MDPQKFYKLKWMSDGRYWSGKFGWTKTGKTYNNLGHVKTALRGLIDGSASKETSKLGEAIKYNWYR